MKDMELGALHVASGDSKDSHGIPESVTHKISTLATQAEFEGSELGILEGLADGLADGAALGVAVGVDDGEALGLEDGETVGAAVGDAVGLAVGAALGDTVGDAVGDEVGLAVGFDVGFELGEAVGATDGFAVGGDEGVADGASLGLGDGAALGNADGSEVGAIVGLAIASNRSGICALQSSASTVTDASKERSPQREMAVDSVTHVVSPALMSKSPSSTSKVFPAKSSDTSVTVTGTVLSFDVHTSNVTSVKQFS